MNGQPYQCGKFAGSMRKYLFREHLGLLALTEDAEEFDVSDPVVEEFYRGRWQHISQSNTEIYENVCIFL